MSRTGLILFAHGARDPRWAEPFNALAVRIRAQRPTLAMRTAFLERMTPDLPTAAAELCMAGCARVEILPLFLGTGGHLRRDLPPLVQELRLQYPAVCWTLHPAIGEHPSVMQAMADAALALLADGNVAAGPAP